MPPSVRFEDVDGLVGRCVPRNASKSRHRMWPFRTIGYFAYFWCSCIASLIDPIWGVVNYMMVYQLHPPARWWGLPLASMGMRFSLIATVFIILGLFFGRRRVP